jgi:hypothetical protein
VIFGNCLEFDRMIESGRRALERARESRDDVALAWALDGMKMVAAHTGDFRSLQAYVAELERLLRPRNDLALLEWALLESAFEPMARARWDEAVGRMHEALSLARTIDDAVNSSWIVSHLAWIERSRGDLDRSLELGLQALSEAEAIGHPWCIPFAEAMVGWTLEERSEPREAALHLRNGLAVAERTAAEFYLVRCLAHLARAIWHLGDTTEAVALAGRAETMLRAVRTPPGTAFLHGAHAYVATADVLLAAGEIDRAGALVRPVLIAAEASDWKEAIASTALLTGLVLRERGEDDAGTRRIRQSFAIATAAGLAGAVAAASAALGPVASEPVTGTG